MPQRRNSGKIKECLSYRNRFHRGLGAFWFTEIPSPGSGSGSAESSVLSQSASGLVNPLTGLPMYHIKLLSMNGKSGFNVGVDFHYKGYSEKSVGEILTE